MSPTSAFQRYLQLTYMSLGLTIISWYSPKFTNFRFLEWWELTKMFRNVFWTPQIKLLQVFFVIFCKKKGESQTQMMSPGPMRLTSISE